MASPIIWFGTWAKNLAQKGFIFSNKSKVEFDGVTNYIANGHFEIDVLGWATYANTAAVTPTTGTGGSPNTTFARSTSSPLWGTASGLITKNSGSSRQGEGISYDFTIDNALKGQSLYFKANFEASANYTGSGGSEYMTVFIYDVTNATLLPQSYNIPAGSYQLVGQFGATTSTSYRLIFHIAGTGILAWTMKADAISVGPVQIASGGIITDWQAYTPTGNITTNATYLGFWRRVGDSIELINNVTFSGANTQGGFIPTSANVLNGLGITLDTNKLPNQTGADRACPVGTWQGLDSGVTASFCGVVNYTGSNSFTLDYITGPTTAVNVNTNVPRPFTISANDNISYRMTLPIVGWSTNVLMADPSNVEYAFNTSTTNANDTSSFGYGSVGNSVPSVSASAKLKRVRFTTVIQPTDKISVEINRVGSPDWFDVGSAAYQNNICNFQYQNTSDYGIGVVTAILNNTDVDIAFGTYVGTSGATYGAAGGAWSGLAGVYNWRVKKISSGSLNGFTNNAALIQGSTSGLAPAANYIGETLTATTANSSALTTGTTINAASLVLTAGCWEVYGKAYFETQTVVTAVASKTVSLSTTSATNNPKSALISLANSNATDDIVGSLPIRVNTTGTTVYLTAVASFTVGAGAIRINGVNTELYAVRIA